MLTLPDFKEKRILFVHVEYGHKHYLQLKNDNIRFFRDSEVINQVSCHNMFAVFIIGDLSITTSLLKKLSSYGISVFFLNSNLSPSSGIVAKAEGNYMLRQKQYLDSNEVEIATNIVENKIHSQEFLLKKTKKAYDQDVFSNAKMMLKNIEGREKLLGIEGYVAKSYFRSLFSDIGWMRRAPQTKEDILNLLLDIGYTYLFNYCDALLSLFGFDTYKGYYHQLFFQRKSLVCDIMEPMRYLIDYQLIKSYNLKQINENDFIFKNGRFEFKDGYKTNKKYSDIFLKVINDNREDIYQYVLDFYRHVMDSNKYKFPKFK